MRWPRILYMRCRSLFGRPRLEDELSDELRFHLQEQIQENRAAGMLPDEARRAALADIGGLDQVKEACRDSRGVTLVENAWRDLRYAWRGLARTPAFMLPDEAPRAALADIGGLDQVKEACRCPR